MAAPVTSILRNSPRFICRYFKVKEPLTFRKRKFVTYIGNNKTENVQCIQRQTLVDRIFRRSYGTGSSSHGDRKCWKCGADTNTDVELFFCNCGVVQIIPSDMTFFKAMQCDEKFDIDVQSLSKLYKDLQRNLHPDKYSQKSREELLLAEQQSSFINKAYTTLLKPLTRGLYLLELHNDAIEESNSDVDTEFLLEIMEVNEDIAEACGDTDALLKVENINSAKIDRCIKDISKAFTDENVPLAKQHLIRLKYFCNVDEKLKEIYREKMDK